MPIYVYLCEDCGEKFEKLVSMSASGQKQDCPKCSAGNTRKLPAAANFSGVKSAGEKSSCASCTSDNCSSCHY